MVLSFILIAVSSAVIVYSLYETVRTYRYSRGLSEKYARQALEMTLQAHEVQMDVAIILHEREQERKRRGY